MLLGKGFCMRLWLAGLVQVRLGQKVALRMHADTNLYTSWQDDMRMDWAD